MVQPAGLECRTLRHWLGQHGGNPPSSGSTCASETRVKRHWGSPEPAIFGMIRAMWPVKPDATNRRPHAARSASNRFTPNCSHGLDGKWLTDGGICVFARVNAPPGRLHEATNRPT